VIRARRAVIAAALIALAACSAGTPVSAPAPETSKPAAPSSSAGTPSGAPSPKASSGKQAGSATPRPTPSVGVRASLNKACVRRGDTADLQGIDIIARPEGAAGFNTIYSDGSSSLDGTSNYDSGYGGGFADSTGHFRKSWVVPQNAPAGCATVRVVAIEDTPSGPAQGSVDLHFVVASAEHPC